MTATLLSQTGKITRADLQHIPVPESTRTHQPIPHHEIVQAVVETLGFRHIGVVRDEYAVSHDGMRMFGVMDLETGMHGCRFSIGLRNANDKSMRLALTVGYRVLVCDNMAFSGDFTPVLAKHSKSFSLVDALSIGVDRMQRNFEPMQRQIEVWRESQISDVTAKLVIYQAFVESELEVPRHLARLVHGNYFDPQVEEFQPRTMWSLSNAFTSAFKELEAVPQFRATARLGSFLERVSPARSGARGG
ncbi:MAG TPA: hypothetical protein VGN17_05285 [Bryobacteraceae bacterium]|jgi:hypothetical protein